MGKEGARSISSPLPSFASCLCLVPERRPFLNKRKVDSEQRNDQMRGSLKVRDSPKNPLKTEGEVCPLAPE